MTPLVNLLIHANGQQHCQHIMLLHDALHGYLQIFTSQYFICGADHDRETLLFSFMRLAITVFPRIIKQLEKRHKQNHCDI